MPIRAKKKSIGKVFQKEKRQSAHFTKLKRVYLILISFIGTHWLLHGQENLHIITIRDDGRMVWEATGADVTGFGVNYTVPFAHAYRTGKKMGIDLKKAIDQDIYQFRLLGLDLFRVHVWDTEISDSLGNLLQNEHLELFDYLLSELKKYKINAVLTPIAYWGNGWPEPDENTPGFSHKYGKDDCLVNPEAIEAQKRYLLQFVRHINPYTGIAYKDEPSILAFEISNEPHHRGDPASVTAFIQGMKRAITSTGCTKPVFYNVSHSIQLAPAYYAAGIDGGTFQWYPTGLGFQKPLGGNMLPNVDTYPVPFEDVMKANHSARLVYEFDAADMASTYLYPAMARSFRSAGMQIGTQFAYDPTFLAPFNTEYNTHYMNLMYAPGKALSLKIAGEVFRNIPINESYGHYPDNTSFGPFRVSYEEDLAEMVTDDKFYYTNSTSTTPPHPERLKHVAGCGSSPVVRYEGSGAYFLDQITKGMWLFQVFPDPIWIDNLFGRNSPEKTRAVIRHQDWPVTIHLPDFERGIFVGRIDNGKTRELSGPDFRVKPGAYLITTPDVNLDDAGFIRAYQFLDSIAPADFYSYLVPPTIKSTFVKPDLAPEITEGAGFDLRCTVAGPDMPDSVCAWYYEGWRTTRHMMLRDHAYSYLLRIPGEAVHAGKFNYYISVYQNGKVKTFPENVTSAPLAWDFNYHESFSTRVVPAAARIYLLDVTTDADRINRTWLPGAAVVPGERRNEDYLYLKTEQLMKLDPENPEGEKIADYTLRHFFGDIIDGRRNDITAKKVLVLDGYTPEKGKLPVRVTLIMKDGSAFGKIVELSSDKREYRVDLDDLEKVQAVLMPRPYPTFLPYYSSAGKSDQLHLQEAESLQISIGPGLKIRETNIPHEFYIGRVWLE